MGRGYSSAGTTHRLDQAKSEQKARIARHDPKRAEREAMTRAEGKAEAQRRNELLKNFKKKDRVTNGTYIAVVKELDILRGEIVVGLMPSGKEMRWSPDFVSKVP